MVMSWVEYRISHPSLTLNVVREIGFATAFGSKLMLACALIAQDKGSSGAAEEFFAGENPMITAIAANKTMSLTINSFTPYNSPRIGASSSLQSCLVNTSVCELI